MNPILLKLGSIKIYWYSFILFISFLIGAFIALKEAKKNKISKDFMYDLFFYLVPIVLIGARIYFVIFNFSYYKDDIIGVFRVWEGGLAIHGGIISGIIFVIYYCKKHDKNILKIADILSVSLILGQAIGRWGNFFNSEAHGPITTLNYLKQLHIPKFIIIGMNIDGNYYEPTFFYESILCLLGFILLVIIRNNKKIQPGYIVSIYMIWYGIVRFFIESLRTDSLMIGNLKIAQLISILMIISGLILLATIKVKTIKLHKSKE